MTAGLLEKQGAGDNFPRALRGHRKESILYRVRITYPIQRNGQPCLSTLSDLWKYKERNTVLRDREGSFMQFLRWAGTFAIFRAWPDRRHPLEEAGNQCLAVNQMNNSTGGVEIKGLWNCWKSAPKWLVFLAIACTAIGKKFWKGKKKTSTRTEKNGPRNL